MTIKLKELSARLGLSQTTVSRALSGYNDVSPVTRERVQQVARELGYQPNRAARQIALGRADAVGIVYPLGSDYLGNPAFLEMLEGLTHVLERANMDLLLAAAAPAGELPVYERMVRGRRVDALVVAQTLVEDPRIDYLLTTDLPFVAFGRTARPDAFPWLDFDNEACSLVAVRKLAALGHRRIAFVHAPLRFNFAFQRHAGYVAAMREAGLEVDPAAVVVGDVGRRTGYAAAERLLALARRPTAILVDNVNAGIGVIRALLDARVAIGSEMSVLICEQVPSDTLFGRVQVAMVIQPTEFETGRTLGEMVLSLIEGRPLAQPHVLRQPVLVNGSSIGPPQV